jgi:primosomal protein N' (replication factor Y)
MVEPAAFVVLDEHDEVHQEERVPTWHARDVVVERARRAGIPCVLTSPMPTLEARSFAAVASRPISVERAGWSIIDVVDRRQEDPRRAGLFSPSLVRQLQGDTRVVCVLNRTGRARLVACDVCGVVATCEACEAAVIQPESDYTCLRCGRTRPAICQACGATANRNIRAGVARVSEELAALVREEVAEVTGSSTGEARSRVVVGTEAALHQVRDAQVVAFLDFDQELLAPRYRAAEQALGLVVRACRLVGGRRDGGRVLIQTRQPDHEVVKAALHGEPDRLVDPESARREILGFPPARAVADVSGAVAERFIEALGQPIGIDVIGPRDGHWLVKAADHEALADALGAVSRPAGRLRIAVDPLRV